MTTLTDRADAHCVECVRPAHLGPTEIGALRARDYGGRAVSSLLREEIGAQKQYEPAGWFERVVKSIHADGILDPLLIAVRRDGQDLVDGHHRAWAAVHHGVHAPALVFTPECGSCTEESFTAAAMERTARLGWRY